MRRIIIIFTIFIFIISVTIPPVNLLDYSMVGMRQGYAAGTEIWFDVDLDGTADIYSVFGFIDGKLVELDGAREYLND